MKLFTRKKLCLSQSQFSILSKHESMFFECIISRNFYRSINIKTNLFEFHMKVVDIFETKNSNCNEGKVNMTYVSEKFLEYLLDT